MRKYLSLFTFFAAATLLFSCNKKNADNHFNIAATATPHAEILEQIQPDMNAAGFDMQIIVVDDYHTPNRALNDGEIDANFFQHPQFLNLQSKEFGYNFEILAKVHLEPMALYSKRVKSLADLPQNAKIAIPNDPTNQARALLLLETKGLLTLNRHDLEAGLRDINANPKQFTFLEIDPPLLSRTLEDVDAAAITTNFALQGGLSPQADALAMESDDSPFVNVVVVRKGETGRREFVELKRLLESDKLQKFIDNRYKGAIIKVND